MTQETPERDPTPARVIRPADDDLSECDFNECDDPPTGYFFGVAPDEDAGEVFGYTAAFCDAHTDEHAADQPALTRIGTIEPVRGQVVRDDE